MDLKASEESVIRSPQGHPLEGQSLPYYLCLKTEDFAGVDALSQDVSRMATSVQPRLGFPPTFMGGGVVTAIAEYRAHAVLVLPGIREEWHPLLMEDRVLRVVVTEAGESDAFFKVCHQRGGVVSRFATSA